MKSYVFATEEAGIEIRRSLDASRTSGQEPK
jgi:hypothetical protein